MSDIEAALERELAEAEHKAWDALGRYKFQMFGYWAAIWVHLNRIGNFKRSNPWRGIVAAARDHGAKGDRTRPTIAELEAILEGDQDMAINILPNGEVRAVDRELECSPKPLTMRESLGGEYTATV